MERAYYSKKIQDFLSESNEQIFTTITLSDNFTDQKKRQRRAWLSQIKILKAQLERFRDAQIIFEYSIPRMSKRIDNVVIYKGTVFVIEFKVGSEEYHTGYDQLLGYVEDLKEFHSFSHGKTLIVPILVATKAVSVQFEDGFFDNSRNIFSPLRCNSTNIKDAINFVISKYPQVEFDPQLWIDSDYKPTPTIIEAAQYLYRNNTVEGISRNEAGVENLSVTTRKVSEIVNDAKRNRKKVICFITGVPGAGKTLVGLNLAIEEQKTQQEEYAIFLSGNRPLVDVLREALIRDKKEHVINEADDSNVIPLQEKISGKQIQSGQRRIYAFIQEIYNFRRFYANTITPPAEHIAIFDEAQRAWDAEKVEKFMQSHGAPGEYAGMSEPEFLISVMNRRDDWAVIVCLVGGGQEINTGEAGIEEWFTAIQTKFRDWDVYVSNIITDSEYCRQRNLEQIFTSFAADKLHTEEKLHLKVSLRQPRNELVSAFVKALLDADKTTARNILKSIKNNTDENGQPLIYPIAITRNIDCARQWVKHWSAKHGGRYGLTVTSTADRMQKDGVWIKKRGSQYDPNSAPCWFLNGKYDVRSSYGLEVTATEYDIQGLEIDWSIVAWGADMRFESERFSCYKFRNEDYATEDSGWRKQNAQDIESLYMKNSYRVLLTRARQGFIIFIPEGDDEDTTRSKEFYDGTYNYLREIGIEEI